jgi:predicted secreted Zn-dependent protease
MRIPCLFLALLAMSSLALAQNINGKDRIVPYPVKGDTAAEIYENIKFVSPRIAPNATFAFTVPYVKTVTKQKKGKAACSYSSFKTSSIFHITLPQLASKRKPPPLLRKQWLSFVDYLFQHEQWHRTNWLGCLKEYDDGALALKAKTCEALDEKREKLFTSVKMRCVQKDEDFDFNFRKEVFKHPFIKAALKKN